MSVSDATELPGTSPGAGWGKILMESVGALRHDDGMEILTIVGAVVTGVVTVIVGLFSLATILFDDLI